MIYVPLLHSLALAYSISCALAQSAPLPYMLKTSDKLYGPDGPWQAVQVQVGSNFAALDLYPGGAYGSQILSNELCSGVSAACGAGGLFDPSSSTTFDNTSITFGKVSNSANVDWTNGAMQYEGSSTMVTDDLTLLAGESAVSGSQTVRNLSIVLVSKATMTYPDGSKYPLQVGQLSLGAPSVNQSFSQPNGAAAVNASLLPGYLWAQKAIPSSSYGLHIGSAALHLPLSLWLGGYDKSRVLGSVSSQPCTNSGLNIDLLDIGIGVDNGASPFPYPARQGILSDGNSSISNSVPMSVVPAAPYIYLPKSTCDAIAKDLPVTFNPKYGLYFWNIQDPRYRQIVASPSYLSFTFTASGGTNGGNITVKVPFQLLNLTLDTPLISTPTSYFPCQPPQLATGNPLYTLGRAFLQAATIGVNWNQGQGQWFLAQAPGPHTASSPVQVNFADTIESSTNAWADTWSKNWTPIPHNSIPSGPNSTTGTNTSGTQPNSSTQPTSSANSTSSGLTTGSKAGIGAGIGCAGIFVGLLGVYFYHRHSRNGQVSGSSSQQEGFVDLNPLSQQPEASMTGRNPAGTPLYEVAGHSPVEMYSDGQPAHELGPGQPR
jgi:hypothetical protein